MIEPETLVLKVGDARVPNNTLPVLVYRQSATPDAAELLSHFERNGWSNGWTNVIYPFHHFHSKAHEVLGIAQGRVEVRLGGEAGLDITLEAGDVVVLPAGTGHKRLSSTGELEVVGAYPEGRDWDLIRVNDADERLLKEARATIAALPLPRTDPIYGKDGPLPRLWESGRQTA